MSRFVGPRTLKWLAPSTTKNFTFGFFVFPAIDRRAPALPPDDPSKTNTGLRIECSHCVGDRRRSSFGSVSTNGLPPSP